MGEPEPEDRAVPGGFGSDPGSMFMPGVPTINFFLRPIFQVPIISTSVIKMQSAQINRCGGIERQWYNCVDAFGMRLARRYCYMEMSDFNECLFHTKAIKRWKAIQKEKRSQWLNGKRDRIEDRPQKLIAADSYMPDYYDYGSQAR